jgi:hypothetical protein
MPDTFVPLAALAKSATGNGFTALEFKPAQAPAGKTPATPQAPKPGAAPTRALQDCEQPKVTLQREGEKVTAIRIECSCGQVVDLNCVY